jgi:hypothetical protein
LRSGHASTARPAATEPRPGWRSGVDRNVRPLGIVCRSRATEGGLVPTHEEFPWERDQRAHEGHSGRPRVESPWERDQRVESERRSGERSRHAPRGSVRRRAAGRQRRLGSTTTTWRQWLGVLVAVGSIAAFAVFRPSGSQLSLGAPAGAPAVVGAPAVLPGAYVARVGPWHYRWVAVRNPPPGTPARVRQRYRIVHYVAVAPVP